MWNCIPSCSILCYYWMLILNIFTWHWMNEYYNIQIILLFMKFQSHWFGWTHCFQNAWMSMILPVQWHSLLNAEVLMRIKCIHVWLNVLNKHIKLLHEIFKNSQLFYNSSNKTIHCSLCARYFLRNLNSSP